MPWSCCPGALTIPCHNEPIWKTFSPAGPTSMPSIKLAFALGINPNRNANIMKIFFISVCLYRLIKNSNPDIKTGLSELQYNISISKNRKPKDYQGIGLRNPFKYRPEDTLKLTGRVFLTIQSPFLSDSTEVAPLEEVFPSIVAITPFFTPHTIPA